MTTDANVRPYMINRFINGNLKNIGYDANKAKVHNTNFLLFKLYFFRFFVNETLKNSISQNPKVSKNTKKIRSKLKFF